MKRSEETRRAVLKWAFRRAKAEKARRLFKYATALQVRVREALDLAARRPIRWKAAPESGRVDWPEVNR